MRRAMITMCISALILGCTDNTPIDTAVGVHDSGNDDAYYRCIYEREYGDVFYRKCSESAGKLCTDLSDYHSSECISRLPYPYCDRYYVNVDCQSGNTYFQTSYYYGLGTDGCTNYCESLLK